MNKINLPLVYELVSERVTRLALHNVRLGLLVGKGDGGDHVGAQVDAEDGDGAQGQRDVGEDEEQERGDLGNVGRERVGDGLFEIVKDEPALLDARDDGRKVVVEQDHVGGLLGHVGPGDAHGDAWREKKRRTEPQLQFFNSLNYRHEMIHFLKSYQANLVSTVESRLYLLISFRKCQIQTVTMTDPEHHF